MIITYSSAFVGSNVANRVADPATGAFTGEWEVIAVPTSVNALSTRSFIFTAGAAETQGQIHVGYNGSYLQEAQFLALE